MARRKAISENKEEYFCANLSLALIELGIISMERMEVR